MKKYDLSGITFLTFVRIDNNERAQNIKAMSSFYRKHCENYSHIFIEDSNESKLPGIIDFHPDDVYVFTKSDTEWRKGEGYNKGIKLARTNIINLIDVDAIVDPVQIIETSSMLLKDENAGLIYPYNGLFLCTNKDLKDNFCSDLDITKFEVPSVFEDYSGLSSQTNDPHYVSHINQIFNKKILVGHINSKGGCVMGRRDNLIRCNGYNPNFIGWGYEDDEAPGRISRLGYNVGRISGANKPLWHLHHFDGKGSKKEDQPFYEKNRLLCLQIEHMSKDRLKNYIRTWTL